jgi:hypothetical protein
MTLRPKVDTYAISAYHHWRQFESRSWWGVLVTTLCDKVWKWLATGRWFSPVSSSNKTDCHDITEILLKVTLNIITPDPKFETKESSQQNHAIVLSNKITFPFMVLEETWFLVPLQPMQTLDLKVRTPETLGSSFVQAWICVSRKWLVLFILAFPLLVLKTILFWVKFQICMKNTKLEVDHLRNIPTI